MCSGSGIYVGSLSARNRWRKVHASVMRFLQNAVDEYDLADRRVLEVGSKIINGSPRELFTGPYWGIDILDGPGVDEILNSHELCSTNGNGHRQPAEVIVSTETLEHDDAPWLSLQQMRQVIEPDGILLLTARGYDRDSYYKVHDVCWDEHGTYDVGDFWRFSVDGMRHLLEQTGWQVLECGPDTDPDRPGVFAIAKAV